MRVFAGAEEIDTGPAKQRAVLAMLLCADGAYVARRDIVRGVWGTSAPATAPQVVVSYVARLRKALEPDRARRSRATVLLSRGDAYALPAGPGDVDARLFEQAWQAARTRRAEGDLDGCARELERGLALWRGTALDGIPGPHAERQRRRLEEVRLAGQEERYALLLEQGRHHEIVPELSALAAAHPFRERVRSLLMLALHRADRQAEALAVFQDTWRTLVEEAGVEPGPELRDLQRRILEGDPGLRPTGPVALAVRTVTSQLPADTSDFVGRRSELVEIRKLAGRTGARPPARSPGAPAAGGTVPRIAVITGPGGIGKTTLAVHAAHQLGVRYPDGHLYARLDGDRDHPVRPEAVLGRLLEDLGVPADRIPAGLERRTALYRTVTAGRRLLLLLDDARRAAQVRPLLPASGDCLVLVTSRSRLTDLSTRTVMRLSPLDRQEARGLLRQAVGAGPVDGEPASVEDVLQVCSGHPLALRVVAARVAGRPPGAFGSIARRLRDEERRLRELAAGDLAVASSLQAGYDSLPDAEAKSAFRLLSLLAVPDLGVSDAAAALGVTDHCAEGHLEALTDSHLLEVFLPDSGAGDQEPSVRVERHRYRFHDLLRVFGRGLSGGLGRDTSLNVMLGRLTRGHLAAVHAADLLLRPGHSAGKDYRGAETPYVEHHFADAEEALAWLEEARGTILGAALQAAATSAVSPAVLAELTTRLRGFLQRCGHWRDWENLARETVRLARAEPDPLAEATGRLELGTLAAARQRLDEARDELRTSTDLFAAAGDTRGEARALNNLGLVHLERGEYAEAAACLERALGLHRSAHQAADAAIALDNLALLHLRQGSLDRAEQACADGLAVHDDIGTPESAAATLNILGLIRCGQGRHAEAVDCQDRSRALARAQGNVYREAYALLDAATAHRALGRCREAVECGEQALDLRLRLGDPHGIATAFTELATTLDAAGHPDRAEACRSEARAALDATAG
ncbi:tetratricopeptide repeat protein [Streptomyces sp. SKN60]|uniref:AfsR/SARP family transcriptional regulator n=1 Tax=Streptomyces sp. SKN60 TaxID=2855506 RepID=UPI0022466389|nr:BTAD domain-containing putative transcriptional regulator [Streptomyces sp. SKN60]MCX2184588.1 tetratricopeptide repeat protein [Streptomyces sp. SKN60]